MKRMCKNKHSKHSKTQKKVIFLHIIPCLCAENYTFAPFFQETKRHLPYAYTPIRRIGDESLRLEKRWLGKPESD